MISAQFLRECVFKGRAIIDGLCKKFKFWDFWEQPLFEIWEYALSNAKVLLKLHHMGGGQIWVHMGIHLRHPSIICESADLDLYRYIQLTWTWGDVCVYNI